MLLLLLTGNKTSELSDVGSVYSVASLGRPFVPMIIYRMLLLML